MAKKNNGSGGKFVAGALVGTALGIAASVFAKSKTGKKLGKEIKAKSAELLDSKEFKQIAEEVYSSFSKLRGEKSKKKK